MPGVHDARKRIRGPSAQSIPVLEALMHLIVYYMNLIHPIVRLLANHHHHHHHQHHQCRFIGRGGLVVTRLPAAREDRGSRRAAGKSLCFHENHCDTQLWARAAH